MVKYGRNNFFFFIFDQTLKIMKAFIPFVTAFLLWCPQVIGQVVTIPDPNFVNFLNNNGFSGAMSGNQMDTQHPSVQNATSIDCSNQYIGDLDGIQYFQNITTLYCMDNPLNNLPALPPNLTSFRCYNGFLNSLPSILPVNLWELDCRNNILTQLPALPSQLHSLLCENNTLISLPALPNSLAVLTCSDNQLTSLPALPTSLTTLNCLSNQLTTLPALPPLLNSIDCSNNFLASLPALPASLDNFVCSNNPLTALPALPSGLNAIIADYTLLTTFPTLPTFLHQLNCAHSTLTSLPALPTGLTDIRVNFNQLTSLPDLPPVLNMLNIEDNPNLVCLRRLKQIANFRFSNTGINCLPNYGDIAISTPNLISLPLCDQFNSNSCDFYYNIAGQVFNDSNSNCINDPGESVLNRMKINLYQGAILLQQVITLQNGLYTIEVPFGTYDYSVDTVGVPFIVNCPASGVRTSVLTAVDSTDLDMDFGLQCPPGFDVGVLTISGNHFVPGDTSNISLIAGDMSRLYNMACATGISGTVQIDFTGPVSYEGPAPGSLTPTTGANSLLYTITDFSAISPYTSFKFFMATDTLAQMGDTVCFTITVTPLSGDFNAVNNQFVICSSVANSNDPNDKQVYPSGDITQYQSWLTYTINFQNTGNAPAQHIVITDTLDANLQESTFTLLDASHEVNTVVTGNIVQFTFANINLPDSVNNEPDSHGYVQYKLKPQTTLQPGDSIQNIAAIYFDFNPPVITNTVVNHVGQPLNLNELTSASINVYPNPVDNELTVITNFNSCDYELIDLLGRSVMNGNFTGTINKIAISNLQPGCYILKLKKNNMQYVERVNVY